MKHRMQITQECWDYDLMTNSEVYATQFCCQEVTVVFVINTVHLPDKQIVQKLKQVLNRPSQMQTQARRVVADIYAIHWCELHQSLSAAAHVTCQSSTVLVR